MLGDFWVRGRGSWPWEFAVKVLLAPLSMVRGGPNFCHGPPETSDAAVAVAVAIAGCWMMSWDLMGDFERSRAPEGGLSALSLPCTFLGDLPEAEVTFLVSTTPNMFPLRRRHRGQ